MKLVNANGQSMQGTPTAPTATRKQATSEIMKLEMIDPDNVHPLEYRVLVRVLAVADITEGGIIKPEDFLNKEMFAMTEAVFISCGDEAFTNSSGDYIENKPKKGDRILTAKYPGNPYRDEDFNLYRFCNDKDVIATLGGNK